MIRPFSPTKSKTSLGLEDGIKRRGSALRLSFVRNEPAVIGRTVVMLVLGISGEKLANG